MSTKAEAIEKELKERYIRNHFFLQRNAPSIFRKVNQDGGIEWKVTVGDDGSINAIVNGSLLYPEDPVYVAEKQVELFSENPDRLISQQVMTVPKVGHVHKRCSEELIDIAKKFNRSMNLSFDFDGKNIPVLIVLGVGFGFHIEKLMKKYNIQHMIVAEPNPDLLKLSLYTLDWQGVFNYFSRPGRSFHVILGDDVKKITEDIVHLFNRISPSFISYIFFFKHFSSEFFDNLKYKLAGELPNSWILWGFFDDEYISIQHTIKNIKKRIPVFIGSNSEFDIPVFVIGSGPSLDGSIEIIRRFQDKALIVSCGTALSALHKAGIKPDFQVEIERTKSTYKTLKEIDQKFLKGIAFIGMNTLYPGVFSLFKEKYIFLKPNDAGSALLPESLPRIYFSNPTVTAAGVSLFANMGFKNIYLFGVDLGTKKLDLVHSKLSNYNADNSFLKGRDKEIKFGMTYEGNFGGEVYTNDVFFNTKKAIENVIKIFNKVRVFNTSDGIKIEGAEPLRSEGIRLEEVCIDKGEIIEVAKSNFFSTDVYKDIDIASEIRALKEDFGKYYEKFKDIDKANKTDIEYILSLFSDMFMYIIHIGLSKGKTKGEYILLNLLSPSIKVFSAFILSNAYSIRDIDARAKYIRESLRALRGFLRDAKDLIDKLVY
ncbi:6-hydroxymethylpterin diphosphokinase MptE-like protein [Hydrogenivirga sp. 128-5-R1-1]|uniref:motility associated factor glycosyltransferase family protein n=1 Tax=Hydrogenivirga sp. 128-5-R1-1 TaxID=392423 RepID=UPI00015EF838|nr:6-hydroxymethylpterin diphosphokinase MptE-like protein [Hydrogenivirga sp. 128-5-R1-1]EDP74922.1 hypothetical protein HG1285_13677 [Hydrogenivirga sp. 128-5-R1-1]